VLLHALPLDGSMWPDEVRGLAPDVVAPTLYGLGDSVEDWARGVLDLAGSGSLDVVGCSVGGSCAVEVARLAPDRVRSLVLVGAKAGHRPEPDRRDAAVRLLAEQGLDRAWDELWAPLFAPDADPAVVARARRIARHQDVDAVIRGVVAFHGRPDREQFLEELDVPVLIVRGEHDRIPRDPAALAARLRHGRFTEVVGAGHYVPLERPAALAEVLRVALDRGPTATTA